MSKIKNRIFSAFINYIYFRFFYKGLSRFQETDSGTGVLESEQEKKVTLIDLQIFKGEDSIPNRRLNSSS